VFSSYVPVFKMYILQGSVVMQWRCGGIFSDQFITNFPQNVPVKNFENRSTFDKDTGTNVWFIFFCPPYKGSLFFLSRLWWQYAPSTGAKSSTLDDLEGPLALCFKTHVPWCCYLFI